MIIKNIYLHSADQSCGIKYLRKQFSGTSEIVTWAYGTKQDINHWATNDWLKWRWPTMDLDVKSDEFQKQPIGGSSSSVILQIGELIDPDWPVWPRLVQIPLIGCDWIGLVLIGSDWPRLAINKSIYWPHMALIDFAVFTFCCPGNK